MAQTLTQDDLDAIVAAITAGKPFVTLADGAAHGGTPGSSTATFAAMAWQVVNPSGDAVVFQATGGNFARGFACLGGPAGVSDFGGYGFYVAGGDGSATRPAQGGFTSASGADGGAGGNDGVSIYGSRSGLVLSCDAGAVIDIVATDGHGISITAAGSGKHDINLAGSGDILGGFTADPEANRGATAGDLTTTLMIERIYRRMFRDAERTPTTVALLANDGTTPIATQPVTDDGAGTETQGPMS